MENLGRNLPHDFGCQSEVVAFERRISRWWTAEDALRGRYVATATALCDQGRLDEAELDPVLTPYLKAWKAFLRDSKAEVLAVEEVVGDGHWGYAGTLDRRVRLNGVDCIIDIKTGDHQAWHALQLAAYQHCV